MDENALEYADYGINYCENTGTFNGINHLYFRKGIAAFKMGQKNYKEILRRALYLSEILGQDNIRELIIESCKEMYSIELD